MKLNQRPGTGKITVTCTYCGTQFQRYASLQINPKTGEPRKIVKCPDCRTVPWQKRFEAMVDKSAGPDACWPFTGGLNADGYGHFPCSINGKLEQRSNRIAHLLWIGPIHEGMYVLHTCKQNRRCCNPKHLYTHIDNQSENTRKQVEDGTHYTKNHPGVEIYNALLDDEKVRYIRSNYRRGNVDNLAKMFGVSKATIRDVWNGRSWKHVKPTDPHPPPPQPTEEIPSKI
jgi:hypothetical protein